MDIKNRPTNLKNCLICISFLTIISKSDKISFKLFFVRLILKDLEKLRLKTCNMQYAENDVKTLNSNSWKNIQVF